MSQTPEPVPCSVMDTVTESPGTTANGTWREAWGSNSIHAWNWDCPLPVETSCVPAWIRSWLLPPPIPTHGAPPPAAPCGGSCGRATHLLPQRVHGGVGRLHGRAVAERRHPGLIRGRGGGRPVDGDWTPRQVRLADVGDALGEQILVDLDQVLVVCGHRRIAHDGGILAGDGL